jgi:hypothetical protein
MRANAGFCLHARPSTGMLRICVWIEELDHGSGVTFCATHCWGRYCFRIFIRGLENLCSLVTIVTGLLRIIRRPFICLFGWLVSDLVLQKRPNLDSKHLTSTVLPFHVISSLKSLD